MNHRNRSTYIVVTIGLLILAVAAAMIFTSWFQSTTRIILGDKVISAKVSKTDIQRDKGLSGVEKLEDGEGMLFIYDNDDTHSIWMKDMKINIDIIWLDKDKEVVHIVKNASPESFPKLFTSKKPARYVLEVPAYYTTRNKITIGTLANFDINALEAIR